MDVLSQTYVADILHIVAQALLVPTIVALLALILYAVFCIGGVLVEFFSDRRHFKLNVPSFLDQIEKSTPEDIPSVIGQAHLLGSQKHLLLTLWDYRCLPDDSHMALAKRLMEEMEMRHAKTLTRNQAVSKVAPMLGLMGTLIPLGPGIVSLGLGDTLTLSTSLLVAFDTTVAGLVVSLITFLITKVRARWYEDYATALEAAVVTMLKKVDEMRESDDCLPDRPTNTADVYAKKPHKGNAKAKKE